MQCTHFGFSMSVRCTSVCNFDIKNIYKQQIHPNTIRSWFLMIWMTWDPSHQLPTASWLRNFQPTDRPIHQSSFATPSSAEPFDDDWVAWSWIAKLQTLCLEIFRFPSCGICIRNTWIDRLMLISSVNISRVVFYLCSNLRKAFGKIVLWESLSLRQVTKGYTSHYKSLFRIVNSGPFWSIADTVPSFDNANAKRIFFVAVEVPCRQWFSVNSMIFYMMTPINIGVS